MMAEEFSAGDWIDRLAGALPALAEAQEPYLPGYREIRAFLPAIPGVEDGGSPDVRVEELGELYARARLESDTEAESEIAQSDGERLRELGIRRMMVMDVRDDPEPGVRHGRRGR